MVFKFKVGEALSYYDKEGDNKNGSEQNILWQADEDEISNKIKWAAREPYQREWQKAA